MNADWHANHPLAIYANEDEQVAWHLAHEKACGCRPVPAWIRRRAERKAAGKPRPARRGAR